MTYSDYLRSEQWIKVSNERKKIDGYTCRGCGCTKNLAAHHIVYPKRWNDTTIEHLVTLCKDCHTTIHRIQEYWDKFDVDKFPLSRDKAKFGVARICAVECWKRNLFSLKEVADYTRGLCDIISSGERCIIAPVELTMDLLATAKDCLIANDNPKFDRSKRKYAKRSKTKYK